MTYTVYFSVYGKKMKVRVQADSEAAAKRQVKDDINIIKVVRNPILGEDDFPPIFKDIFGL